MGKADEEDERLRLPKLHVASRRLQVKKSKTRDLKTETQSRRFVMTQPVVVYFNPA